MTLQNVERMTSQAGPHWRNKKRGWGLDPIIQKTFCIRVWGLHGGDEYRRQPLNMYSERGRFKTVLQYVIRERIPHIMTLLGLAFCIQLNRTIDWLLGGGNYIETFYLGSIIMSTTNMIKRLTTCGPVLFCFHQVPIYYENAI